MLPVVERPTNSNIFNSLYCPIGCCRSELVESLLLFGMTGPVSPNVVLEITGCQNDEEHEWAERWLTKIKEQIDEEALARWLAGGE